MRKLTPLLFVLFSCTNTPSTTPPAIAKVDTTLNSIGVTIPTVDSTTRAEKEKQRAILLKKFSVTKDEFRGIKFYRHKGFGTRYWPSRKALYTYVNTEGSIFLVSNYYGADWVFHHSATVLVGDQKFQTSDVPTYQANNKTDNGGGMVWENVTYTDFGDKKIIEAIANNPDKVVKVRLNGRQYYGDFTMPDADKKAFGETWALYNTFK